MTFDELINTMSRKHDWDSSPVFTVAGYPGIGWRIDQLEVTTVEIEVDGDLIEQEDLTGQVIMHMIGDRERHVIDPADIKVHPDDVCSCGQIECGWHVS